MGTAGNCTATYSYLANSPQVHQIAFKENTTARMTTTKQYDFLDSANTVVRSYVWGLDLSGSMQGAGGVGGLLMMKPASGNRQFVAFDGNGNVMGLVDSVAGTVTATEDYGPFGEPLKLTPNQNHPCPFRFSTKYQDDESDLYYYGYRYYVPSTGRWPNRDPLGERGGMNLYGFIRNSPIALIDYLGLIAAGDVINTEFGDVKILRQPTPAEREMGNKAVCVVSKLISVPQYPPWNDLWIADMGIEGLNYRASSGDRTEYIFIEKSMVAKTEWQLNGMLSYGIVLAHESDHYYTDSDDPETGHRINDRAWEAARKAMDKKIDCKYCIVAGFWKIRNQLEIYACECGIDLSKSPGRDPLE